ncbi:hypothetical protein Tco_0844666 [Tanacetum coccineum]
MDNENEYEIEDLGYESEEEYGKPGGVKLSVTFDALNRISRKHRALFSSFLGDMVREHIGLQILSWKKVGPEARNKLWDEITRYFDVDLTVRKLVMNRLGQLLRNFRRKLRQTYILPNQDTPSKLNEVPTKYSAILKAEDWVNFVNYTATEEYKVKFAKAKMLRSKCVFSHTMRRGGYAHVKEKMKETEDKIKEGTLQVDQGTDAMTLVLGKEKGGYARGVGSGVTYQEVSLVEIHPINSSADEGGRQLFLSDQKMMRASEGNAKTATPPSTIQMITVENKTAPKVPTKRKNFYVSSDAMQKEANKKRSQKALVY